MESGKKPEVEIKEMKITRELVITRKEDENYKLYIQYVIKIKGVMVIGIGDKEIRKNYTGEVYANVGAIDDIKRDIEKVEEEIRRTMNEEFEHLKKLIDVVDVVSILL